MGGVVKMISHHVCVRKRIKELGLLSFFVSNRSRRREREREREV